MESLRSRSDKPAVVLLSGGLDSATTAAIALNHGFSLTALSVDYGQRHFAELDATRNIAKQLGITDHRIVKTDLRPIGGSSLTAPLPIPLHRSEVEITAEIPNTYVPARNTILLALALGLAETVGAFDLFIGINAVDYSGYPDCRPDFVEQFATLANLATKAGVEGKGRFNIHAPLVQWTKAQIILEGTKFGIDYSQTVSCYQADTQGRACGSCDSCHLRRKGFEAAGLPDPTRYRIAST